MLTPDLVLPRYRAESIDGVLGLAARLIDQPVEQATAAELAWQTPLIAEVSNGAQFTKVVVVLVDGLGYHLLQERSGHAPFLRSHLSQAHVLTTGFPSTTATSLGTFGSAQPPGMTGMLGYTIRDPHTKATANLVSWNGVETQLQPADTIFERLTRRGVTPTAVGLSRFENSGLTRAALRGANYVACDALDHRVGATVNALRRSPYVYLYWGELDKAGHQKGWQSEAWLAELEALDSHLRQLIKRLPADTAVIVTADHGMIDVDRTQAWEITEHSGLLQDVELTVGEPRATYLHTSAGTGAAEVAERWQNILADAALVLTKEQAITTGLFGPAVGELARSVMGDVVVLARDRAVILDARTQTAASRSIPGVHGSLTPHEAHVPMFLFAGQG